MSSWGEAGPPDEAYGRVTDAARFAPLHDIARDVLDDLARRYRVSREEFTDDDGNGDLPAPGILLTPTDPAAAPLAVVFTAFPGLIGRMGAGCGFILPMCGCDACDETVDDCAERLHARLDALVAGTFGARLVSSGGWWHEAWYRTSDGASESGRVLVAGDELASLRSVMPTGELRYAPWQVRLH